MKNKTRLKQLLLLLFVFTFSAAIAFGQDCGDVNSTGTTDIVDALLVAQCYVGLISCPPAEIGDVNCDGAIDIVDALLIAQLYVGLISDLNCCETPTPPPTPAHTSPPTPPPIPMNFFHAYFNTNIMIAVNHGCGLPCNDLNENLQNGLPRNYDDISNYINQIKDQIANSDTTKEDAIDAAKSFIEFYWEDIRDKIYEEIDKAFLETNCYYIRFEQGNYCTTYVFLDLEKDLFEGKEFAFYIFVLALQLRAQDIKNSNLPSYIDQISPDWLMTAHNMIEGGPGGAAAECPYPTSLINNSAYQFLIQNRNSIIPASDFFDGEVVSPTSAVHVYILDTIPFIYDSFSTYSEKAADIRSKITDISRTNSNHPAKLLLGNLPGYNENGFIKRNDSLCCDICKADIFEIPDQDYNTSIPDHGIFIAGLIRSIAPDATIEILQTLNSSGVGSMQTFLCALIYIHRNMDPGKKIIINCSFGLKCSFKNPETVYEAIVADPWAVDLAVVKSLETLMNMFRDTTVFASTGNNNGAESTYPAALDLEHVIGVGSLGIERIAGSDSPLYKRASYSNTTKRTRWGFYAPGGMLRNPTASREYRVTSDEKGLFGLYLGDEETGDPPIYAYWCGTSFAASIVAGVFANLYRQYERDYIIDEILRPLNENLLNFVDDNLYYELFDTDIIAVPIIQQHMYNNR